MNSHPIRTIPATLILLGAQLAAALAGDDEAQPPAPIGQRIESFQVKDCTGPASGKTLCYACRYAGRPVVALFVRELGGDVMRLVKHIDDEVVRRRDQRMAAFVVLLADDTLKIEQLLKDLAREHRLQRTPLTIYRGDLPALQADYHLDAEATVTVLMWRDGKIQASEAFNSTDFGQQSINRVSEQMAAPAQNTKVGASPQ